MSTGALLDQIADIGRQLEEARAVELATLVAKCDSPVDLEAHADSATTPTMQKMARRIAKVWEVKTMPPDSLAMALRGAQAAAEAERRSETVSLTWTGPTSPHVPVARNDQALYRIVSEAKQSLLLVSYATYKMPELVGLLEVAVERGVAVDLVLEFVGSDPGSPSTWDPVKGLGPTLPDGVRVFQWPLENRTEKNGKVGYIHVKTAVADDHAAFVSSANLTTYAMEMNMELGVVIRGGEVPARIGRHFRALIDEGILVEVVP